MKFTIFNKTHTDIANKVYKQFRQNYEKYNIADFSQFNKHTTRLLYHYIIDTFRADELICLRHKPSKETYDNSHTK